MAGKRILVIFYLDYLGGSRTPDRRLRRALLIALLKRISFIKSHSFILATFQQTEQHIFFLLSKTLMKILIHRTMVVHFINNDPCSQYIATIFICYLINRSSC
ncbi:hypothetical protein SAMN04488053_10569 [Alkalicoccus daliensis]|uniref:Uncharacterized protein n=1 Tax=Alkalicoccus daliensis TaxID=745820 RepID=A0A1H0FT09_9BACI|nr:hypothetical protein SAMN04488053_10569 [Alkalicoccus daliensis]